MSTEQPTPRAPSSLWLQALRLYATSASVIPLLLGIVLAWPARQGNGLVLGLCALFGGVALHLATNLLNDVGDYRSGVDRPGISEGSGVLTAKLLTDAQVARAAYGLFALGALFGLPVLIARGTPVFVLGVLGVLGGWGYTAGPKYKYLGLGDVCVGALMGPLMTLGAYVAVSGQLSSSAALASIPIGFHVIAILHANNLRDIDSDGAAGIVTVARVLGFARSKTYYAVLVLGAYAVLALLVLFGVTAWPTLAAWLTVPIAIGIVSKVNASESAEAVREFQPVENTAKLHMLFGLLTVIGAAIGHAL